MVFDKQWFQQNNDRLCWFANAPVIKYWFRWLLRIHNDIPFSAIINQITPNSFTYNGKINEDKIELTTDFRTHEKFGKRLYYGLKPLWYLLHFWDWSTSIQPALNCGFDTLTVYPDASTGGTTVDGYIQKQVSPSENWATIRTGDANQIGASASSGQAISIFMGGSSGQFDQLTRSIFTLDTSALTSSATISATVFSLYHQGNYNDMATPCDIDIYTSTPAANNNLESGDYVQIGTTSQTGSPISYNDFIGAGGYNAFTFNSTGKGNVSKTGISKFGARNANYDVANSAPSHVAYGGTQINIYFADQSGTSNDPKLVVTYTTVVGPANVKTYKGLAAASVKTLKGLAIASVKTKKGLN